MQQAGGHPALMARIALAFVEQLPQWRAELAAAATAPDRDRLSGLLHKMKGSCHAVSATAAAETFANAELAFRAIDFKTEAPLQQLLALVSHIEAELRALIGQQDAQAPDTPRKPRTPRA